ncbi:MAG: phosphate acyltransferase PlsX [Gammaproteobacteria bacterium]|nr:phosphate acyltransferase PlsX [Gammaproteobacteria bacterium]
MSGDKGVSVTVAAALDASRQYPHLQLVLVGDLPLIERELALHGAAASPRLQLRHATEVVLMDELPSRALRGKKDSSMRVAINMVKNGEASACVSAGNTGALMATARYVLKTLEGIDRPAIIAAFPTIHGYTRVLDLGANVDSSAEVLYQFAMMGSILSGAVDNIASPTVGLLNIGEEEIKGNEQVKAAHQLLSQSPLNYQGYIEGDDICKGSVDVVVCDGFVGNVALKTSEGLAKMVKHYIRQEFSRNLLTKMAGLVAMPVLKAFGSRIDPRTYNGASLVGLRGIVIKSHGGADQMAFVSAIRQAVLEVANNVPELIKSEVCIQMQQRHSS